MEKKLLYISMISAGVLLSGCEKPYTPPAVKDNLSLLVVEGNINTGQDSTIIKLSRTVTVTNNVTTNPETKATVSIENAQSTVYTLTEGAKGIYAAPPLNLDNTKQYRLRVKTSAGKTYLSDLVGAKVTPAIDSVGFTVKDNGVLIYANTHDAANNTHYYKYTYQETWKFHTKFFSSYVSDGRNLHLRTPDQNIFYCFGNDVSTTTIVNSTAALAQDITYQLPITLIDRSSEKIQIRYSILLTQQALSQEGYIYWNNLAKNADGLGGLFSTQPSQLNGNIHNINDAGEQVIGYISAATTQKKRIFIDVAQLPATWDTKDLYGCSIDSALILLPSVPRRLDHPYVLVSYLIDLPPRAYALNNFTDIILGAGYAYSSIPCADCRTRGTLQQPAFWK